MRVRSSRFVGRERELGQLVGWLDEAREGRPRVVIVGGEAGVGKSRLVTEFGRAAAERDAGWLIGAAADYGAGGLPFGPLVDALRPTLRDPRQGPAARLGPARHELARLFPGLATAEAGAGDRARPPTDAGSPVDDELSQVRLLGALLRLLELIAEDRPAVLILEDLHWVDASTRDFLAFLARNLGELPLLVVGTYRSDDVGRGHPLRRYFAELARVGSVERLELERLDRNELAELVSAILGADADQRLINELFARSQGNAFFSEELLAAATSIAGQAGLPSSLRDILLARVERLSSETRVVLEAASVIGWADERLLPQATGMAEPDIGRALREALDQSVIEPASGGAPGIYSFRHALAREAIYDDLLTGERSRFHERVARALAADEHSEEAPDAQLLARLAYHWQHANQPRETFVYAWRAGRAAELAHAFAEASLHFGRVLAAWDSVGDPAQLLAAELSRAGLADARPDRAEVLLRAGLAAHFANDHGQASVLLRRAAEEVDPDGDPDRAARAYADLMWSLTFAGQAAESGKVMERLQAHLPACSPRARLRALNEVVAFHEHYGALPEALALSMTAVELADSVGDQPAKAQLLIQAGRSRSFVESLEPGLAELEAGRALADEAGDARLVGFADKDKGIVLQSAGRFEEALAAFESSQRYLQPLGLQHITRHTDAEIGFALHRLGRWREADEALERALAPPANDWAYVVWAYVLVATGRLEEGGAMLARSWPSVDISEATTSYGPYYTALGTKYLWEGRPEEALRAVDEGLGRTYMTENWRWLSELAVMGLRAAADMGQPARERAVQLRDLQRTRTGTMFEPPRSIFADEGRGWLATGAAEMSRLEGSSSPALWAKAVDAWRATGRPHELAYTLYRQAEATLAGGAERETAREPLAEALQLASGAGSRLLVGVIEQLGRRARLEIGAPDAAAEGVSPGDHGLTSREREVLALLAQGRTDQQIAEALFISPKTASVHVSNIKAKLGVERRIEAAAIGAGLISDG